MKQRRMQMGAHYSLRIIEQAFLEQAHAYPPLRLSIFSVASYNNFLIYDVHSFINSNTKNSFSRLSNYSALSFFTILGQLIGRSLSLSASLNFL